MSRPKTPKPTAVFRLGLLAALLVANTAARAQGTPGSAATSDSTAAADALFTEGGNLYPRHVAEAREKFVASFRARPSFGAAYNAAMCDEDLGHTATAWMECREAQQVAAANNEAERVTKAQQCVERLEPKLIRLAIVVRHPEPGLTITRNGTAVDPALLGQAFPVDPGVQSIEASAPGRAPWRGNVDASVDPGTGAGRVFTIDVPSLVPVATPAPLVGSTQPSPGSPASPAQPSFYQRHRGSIIAGGAAVVLAGVGAGLGFRTWRHYDDLAKNCAEPCPADDVDSVKTEALAANIAFGAAGAAALVSAGLFVFVEKPNRSSVTLAPTVGGASMVVRY